MYKVDVCPHKLCSFIVYGTRKCVHWGGVQRILLFVGRTGVPDVYFYSFYYEKFEISLHFPLDTPTQEYCIVQSLCQYLALT